MAVTALAVSTGSGHLLDDAQTRRDRAERRVVRRQLGVLVDEEELAAVGSGPGVGHRYGCCRVGCSGQVLIGELVARSAAARAGRIAALQHEYAAGHQAV